jgi:non-heme chloroperoxidase
VLIHGWPLNSDMWDYQARFLAHNGFRVIAYDRRGFGRSDKPWNGYEYDTFANDLADLIEHLDLRDVSLVGFSMGGGEVVRYAARYGTDRIARAALVSAVTPFLLETPDHDNGVKREVFDQMIDGLEADRPHFLAQFGKKFFGVGVLNQAVSTEMLQWALMMAMQASPKATIDCVRAFGETDFRPDMPKLTVPTLVIHGFEDKTVPIDLAGRAAVEALPNAQLIEYRSAPHGLFVTDKDRLNENLLAFLKG